MDETPDHYTVVLYLSTTGALLALESNASPHLTEWARREFVVGDRPPGVYLTFIKVGEERTRAITRAIDNRGYEAMHLARGPADLLNTHVRMVLGPSNGHSRLATFQGFDEAYEAMVAAGVRFDRRDPVAVEGR